MAISAKITKFAEYKTRNLSEHAKMVRESYCKYFNSEGKTSWRNKYAVLNKGTVDFAFGPLLLVLLCKFLVYVEYIS